MRRTVAVVGGGCTGAMVTMDLLRCTGVDVVLIEPGEPGAGLAYGTAQPWHLLNSRAGAMSADPDDPGHFVRWAEARRAGELPEATPGADRSGAVADGGRSGVAGHGRAVTAADFLARRTYGRYLGETFAAVVARHPGRYVQVRDRAAGLDPDGAGWIVRTAAGDRIHAADVVLATGGAAPAVPVTAPPGVPYVTDPWQPGVLEALPADRPVLLVGTGLTAVDVALTLTAGGTRTAPVVAVSRSGRLPQAHAEAAAPPASAPVVPVVPPGAGLRAVLRALRDAAREAGDWRPVVDGLRPQLDRLWAGWTVPEQDRFLRHLARTWECHRHRMAPAVAARIAELQATGLLEVHPGGVGALTPAADGLLAELPGAPAAAPDGPTPQDPAPRVFAAVINCAGPGRLPGAADPFVAALLDAGLARVGPHGLGLDVDPTGRLKTAAGTAHPALRVAGPLRRGVRWETTAVPEIRAQARELATHLNHPEAVITVAV